MKTNPTGREQIEDRGGEAGGTWGRTGGEVLRQGSPEGAIRRRAWAAGPEVRETPKVIGPPDNSRCERLAFSIFEEPLAWAVCIGVGLTLTWMGRRNPNGPPMALGLTIMFLSPLPAMIDRSWIGQFPNIDKEGSLAHYLAKVHHIWPWQGELSPGLRRIGVHIWHLWPVELLDRAFPTVMSFNLVLLLNVFATLYFSSKWFHHEGARPWGALLAALPFTLGPPMLRHLEWSTIEKSSLFWLPLYLWTLRSSESGGTWRVFAPAGVATLICSQNLYWLILCGVFSLGIALNHALNLLASTNSRSRRLRALLALVLVALAVLPWVYWQSSLNGLPDIVIEESWRNERAALDAIQLNGWTWARLPLWRALEPLSLSLGVWFLCSRAKWRSGLGIAFLGAMSLGPYIMQGESTIENPLWAVISWLIPGFWRVAKPEVFFLGAWLLVLSEAAKRLNGRWIQPAALWLLVWVLVGRVGEWWPEPSKLLELPAIRQLDVGGVNGTKPN